MNKIMLRNVGYTFAELTVFLICLAIFMGLSGLTWIHYASNIKSYVRAERMKSALMYAQSQAIKQKGAVIFCGSRDGSRCDGDWGAGQVVKVLQTDKILRYFPPFRANTRVQFVANFGRSKQIVFLSTGATEGQQGHFSFCSMPADKLQQHCTSVSVSLAGEIELGERVLTPNL